MIGYNVLFAAVGVLYTIAFAIYVSLAYNTQ